MGLPTIKWDFGTAYDMMVSLNVLHNPGAFGLRAAWAAGMRSRLPASEREFLEKIADADLLQTQLSWLYELDDPKDGASLLRRIAETPAPNRLRLIYESPQHDEHQTTMERLMDIQRRGKWNKDDLTAARQWLHDDYAKYHKTPSQKQVDSLPTVLTWWAEPSEFGELYQKAMETYYEVFFAEEERRIAPALNDAMERAHELAETLPVPELLEELSQGVRSEDMMSYRELVLAPCYWSTPLILYDKVGPDSMMVLFGARPDTDSLVPGEDVPEALVQTLKAISDPTRLRILRYLSSDRLTPSQLARRLRLRPPTVIHHLQALRAARLVQLQVDEGKERIYAARPKAIQDAYNLLTRFLEADAPPHETEQ